MTVEYSKFYLVNVYTPNSGEFLKRLNYRINTWDKMFRIFIEILQKKKKVIICGDMNVAHEEIDIKNPKSNLRSAGFTVEERLSFSKLLSENNLLDSFRFLYPTTIKYSYWSYRMRARERNTGWRLDYFLIDDKLKNKLIKSDILIDIYGSDHAPVIIELNL